MRIKNLGRINITDLPQAREMNVCKSKSETNFVIDQSDWEKLRRNQTKPNTLPLEWVNIFSSKLRNINDVCSFIFIRHYVRKQHSRKRSGLVFKADGRCSFSDCPVTCHLEMDCERKLKVNVKLTGTTCHRRNEIRARYVRGQDRRNLMEKLQHKPLREYLYRINKLSDETFLSGCRDMAPSKSVLEKISSEGQDFMRGVKGN